MHKKLGWYVRSLEDVKFVLKIMMNYNLVSPVLVYKSFEMGFEDDDWLKGRRVRIASVGAQE